MRPQFLLRPLPFGLLVAFVVLVLDQVSKTAVLAWSASWTESLHQVTPFLDFVSLWNTGISYGLFPQGEAGRWVLVAVKVGAALLFGMVRSGGTSSGRSWTDLRYPVSWRLCNSEPQPASNEAVTASNAKIVRFTDPSRSSMNELV